jgi:hypothetical protein
MHLPVFCSFLNKLQSPIELPSSYLCRRRRCCVGSTLMLVVVVGVAEAVAAAVGQRTPMAAAFSSLTGCHSFSSYATTPACGPRRVSCWCSYGHAVVDGRCPAFSYSNIQMLKMLQNADAAVFSMQCVVDLRRNEIFFNLFPQGLKE